MNLEQLKNLKPAPVQVVGAAQLQDRTARTLLFGYTCERETWHVYLDEAGVIHRVVYDHRRGLLSHQAGQFTSNTEYVPDKRLYSESCDFEFCALLVSATQSLPFTTHDEIADVRRRKGTAFAGLRVHELAASHAAVAKS